MSPAAIISELLNKPVDLFADATPVELTFAPAAVTVAIFKILAAVAALLAAPAAVFEAAVAGVTDKSPTPKAATATSDIRLRSVIFDIFFLSLVENRNFL
jgi:hypothetical protein